MLYTSKIQEKKNYSFAVLFPKISNALAKSKRTEFPMHSIIAIHSSVGNLRTTVYSKICFEMCLFLAYLLLINISGIWFIHVFALTMLSYGEIQFKQFAVRFAVCFSLCGSVAPFDLFHDIILFEIMNTICKLWKKILTVIIVVHSSIFYPIVEGRGTKMKTFKIIR